MSQDQYLSRGISLLHLVVSPGDEYCPDAAAEEDACRKPHLTKSWKPTRELSTPARNSKPLTGLWPLRSRAWIWNVCSIKCPAVSGKLSSCTTARTTLTWRLLNLQVGRSVHPSRNCTKRVDGSENCLNAGRGRQGGPRCAAVPARAKMRDGVGNQTKPQRGTEKACRLGAQSICRCQHTNR